MTFLTELKRHHNEPKSPSEYIAYGMWLIDHAQEIINLVEAAETLQSGYPHGNFMEMRNALAALNKE